MFKYLNNILLIVSVIVGGIFLSPKLFGKTLVLPYIVTSGSMSPAIPSGSAVFVVPDSAYSPGDILTFNPNGDRKTTVTHRLLFTEPRLITAGDANSDFDQFTLKPEHIIGKVIFHIPYVGYVADFAKTPHGFILLVIVPATIIIYEELKAVLSQLGKVRIRLAKKPDPNPVVQVVSEMQFSKSAYHPSLLAIPIFFASLITTTLTLSYFMDTESSSGSYMSAYTPVTPPLPTPNR